MKKSKSKNPTVPLPERHREESPRLYQRFLTFCLMAASNRTIDAVFQAEQGGEKGKKRAAPGSYYRAAEMWGWRERAAQYDHAVAVAEAEKIAEARKNARAERATLVSKFVASASALLDDSTILANAPAGTSAAVLRAVEASRREFGSDILPEDTMNAPQGGFAGNGKFPNMRPPCVELYIDNGDGTHGRMDEQPPPDVYDPANDPPGDEDDSADLPQKEPHFNHESS